MDGHMQWALFISFVNNSFVYGKGQRFAFRNSCFVDIAILIDFELSYTIAKH